MSLACPVDFDSVSLRRHVVEMYERVADTPADYFHFNVGADYAVRHLGYDRAELESLPAWATSRFAGVGNPFAAGEIPTGATVVDHACGAGTDLLIAARRAGAMGHAIGVDITPAMQRAARRAAFESGLSRPYRGARRLVRRLAGSRCQRGRGAVQRRPESGRGQAPGAGRGAARAAARRRALSRRRRPGTRPRRGFTSRSCDLGGLRRRSPD